MQVGIRLSDHGSSLNQTKDEFDQLNLYCYCLFGINGFVLFLCSLVISSRMLNSKTCYLLLMICTFLTAIVFLVILGLTVGISFTKGLFRQKTHQPENLKKLIDDLSGYANYYLGDEKMETEEKPGKVKRLLEEQSDQVNSINDLFIKMLPSKS